MGERRTRIIISLGAIALSALLLLVAIPYGVSTPSTVSSIFLSPLFWPNVLAWLTGLVGLLMIPGVFAQGAGARAPDDEDESPPRGAALRLAAMAVLMVIYLEAIGLVGMVWASMAAFVALAFLVRTAHPVAAVVTGLAAPLVLYVFFAHVAGVAIPQGDFVRLP